MTEWGQRCDSSLIAWLLSGGEDVAGPPPSAPNLALLRRHRLAPLAHRMGIPGLRRDWTHAALAAERWLILRSELCQAFDRAGIPLLVLKGGSYLDTLYADPAERPMGDLDVLVRPEDMERAIAALGQLGFAVPSNKPHARAASHHAISLGRKGIGVDLHRHMLQAGRSHIDIQACWTRAKCNDHRLAPLDEAAIHVAHLLRHELMVPLMGYVDLGRLLERTGCERPALLERCKAWRIERGARAVLRCYDELRTGRPSDRGELGALPSCLEVIDAAPLPRWRALACKLQLSDGAREAAALAWTTAQERVPLLARRVAGRAGGQ